MDKVNISRGQQAREFMDMGGGRTTANTPAQTAAEVLQDRPRPGAITYSKDIEQIVGKPLFNLSLAAVMEWIRRKLDIASGTYCKVNLVEQQKLIDGLRRDHYALTEQVGMLVAAVNQNAAIEGDLSIEIKKIEAILGLSRVYSAPMEYYLKRHQRRKPAKRRSRK